MSNSRHRANLRRKRQHARWLQAEQHFDPKHVSKAVASAYILHGGSIEVYKRTEQQILSKQQ